MLTIATMIDPRFKDSVFDEDISVSVRQLLISELADLIPKSTVRRTSSPGPGSPKKPRLETSALFQSVMKNKVRCSDSIAIDPSIERVSYYLKLS